MTDMRIQDEIERVSPKDFHSPVAVLGTFDGVHRGHGKVVGEAVRWAHETGAESVVLTFRRHPRRVLSEKPPSLLVSLSRRLELLEDLGVDAAVVLDFDRALASRSARAFAEGILAGTLGARRLVLGPHARFGRGREGDADFLSALGFEVRNVPPLVIEGAPASSSRLRETINRGDLEAAEAILGRPVELEGRVVRGKGRGRDLGFPTANLHLHHEVRPPAGVYAGRLPLDGVERLAMVSIGSAPTFPDDTPLAVEVHIPGFEADLYGRDLRVSLAGRIRGQRRFENVSDLSEAIRDDIRLARERFSLLERTS